MADCVKLLVFGPADYDTHVTIARTPRAASTVQFREVLDLIHGHRGSAFHLIAAHEPGESGRIYQFDLIAGEAFDLIRTGLRTIFDGNISIPRDGPLQAHSARNARGYGAASRAGRSARRYCSLCGGPLDVFIQGVGACGSVA